MQSQFKFCPMCGEGMAMKKSTYEHVERNTCAKCGYIDYNNSRPTVGVMILNEKNEILLVRRAWHPFKGYLDLPGGFIETCEHPEEAARREIEEELGIEIKVNSTVFNIETDVYDDGLNEGYVSGRGAPVMVLYYLAKITKGEPRVAEDELAGFDWYPLVDIPKFISKIAFKSNQKALMLLYRQKIV